jgi:hypothetical protein
MCGRIYMRARQDPRRVLLSFPSSLSCVGELLGLRSSCWRNAPPLLRLLLRHYSYGTLLYGDIRRQTVESCSSVVVLISCRERSDLLQGSVCIVYICISKRRLGRQMAMMMQQYNGIREVL